MRDGSVSRTFYKRDLPCPPAIPFSSEEGQAIFTASLADGTMKGFFKLIEQFRTQDDPAYCGLASLSMVLNTLAIDPRRPWKGPWRYFHEQMLDCCVPLDSVRQNGVTLQQLACLAKCNGATADLHFQPDVTIAQFREMVLEATSLGTQHLVLAYTRKALQQTGDGHFSPIGGYSRARDMVLILDTARFKYPPHWVPLQLLHTAMGAMDVSAGRPRGFLRIGVRPKLDSVLFTLGPAVEDLETFVNVALPSALSEAASSSLEGVLAAAVDSISLKSLPVLLACRSACCCRSDGMGMQAATAETLLAEIRGTGLYLAVAAALANAASNPGSMDRITADSVGLDVAEANSGGQEEGADADFGMLVAERLTVLLLLIPKQAWSSIQREPSVYRALDKLLEGEPARNEVLAAEVCYLKEQLAALEELKEQPS